MILEKIQFAVMGFERNLMFLITRKVTVQKMTDRLAGMLNLKPMYANYIKRQ